ncbi:MAG TPA: flagellar biosynthesis protein FlhB [Firmicutes bacterium]|nr:flagellar biosynthesis protein FlhB [Bacillota bacterium]
MILLRFDLQLFAEEKTELATPKRRQEARRKGQTARSNDLSSALVLLAALLFIFQVMPVSGMRLLEFASHTWQNLYLSELDIHTSGQWLWQMALQAGQVVIPLFAVVFFVALLSSTLQVGLLLSATPLSPSLQRINPLEGFKRMFSKRALVELLKSMFKLGGVALIVYQSASTALSWSLEHIGAEMGKSLANLSKLVFNTSMRVVAFLLALGLADYIYQRLEFSKSLRMSKQEIKEEYRQAEGDPQLRARMRERQRLLARRRMMHDVPRADVVIVNPVHLAIALKYDPEQADAPIVLAKGQGYLAGKIKEIAASHSIAIVENRPLAQTLFKAVDVGEAIPPQFYQAVAEVLAFVFRIQGRR